MGIGMMSLSALPSDMKRGMLSVLGAVAFFCSGFTPAHAAASQHVERHFAVNTRPVVVIHNVANGRIEVKSWKNKEVDRSEERRVGKECRERRTGNERKKDR